MRAARITADEQYRLIMECRVSGLTWKQTAIRVITTCQASKGVVASHTFADTLSK